MNKFTATHPDTGQVAKRSSKNRTYTHAVWVRKTQAQRIADVEARIASNRKSIEWAEQIIAGGEEEYVATKLAEFPRLGQEYFAERFAKLPQDIEGWQVSTAAAEQELAAIDGPDEWGVFKAKAAGSIEERLDAFAEFFRDYPECETYRQLDRFDERTFDTDDFPKVVFASQVGGADETERCGRCGGEI